MRHHFTTCALLLTTIVSLDAFAQFPDKQGYTPLFNRHDLSGWSMQGKGIWKVQGGGVVGTQDPTVGKDSWLFTDREWDDFALTLEFKITKGGNSGVGIRMPAGQEGRPSQYGYEIQICDRDEKFPTGSVFRHTAASRKLHNADPQAWNTMHVTCVKEHIVVYLNRQKVVDERLKGSQKGRVGLQVHGGEKFKEQRVEFRNIKIKDLKPQYETDESPVRFEAHPIDNLLSEGCAVVDINRDGKLDITCGPRWYEAPSWKAHEFRAVPISGEYMSNYGEAAIDVNEDGWPDIVSGGWFTPILCWYENPGKFETDEPWKEHVIADNLSRSETIIAGDLNRDGRTDILVNRYDERVEVAYYANVGLAKSKTGFERRVVGIDGRGHGGGFADLNADERADVLTPSGWYAAPADPKSDAWTFTENFRAPHSSIPFVVGDFNNDGMADVVWSHAHDFGLYWLEQGRDSAGRQGWFEHVIDDSFSQGHNPVLADLDRDGTRDIIVGKRYRGHNGGDPGAMEPLCIFWYRVTKGPDPKFTKHIVSYDENIGTGMNFAVEDIDADGDIDIVVPGKTGLYLLENVTKK